MWEVGLCKVWGNLNVPFTTYYGLVNAIPKDWKAILTNPIPNVTHANTTVNSLRTSSIYSSLLNTVFVPPTAETKILRHGFTILYPFKVTNEVKIIMFQYKVIHNRLCKYILKNKNLQNATKTEKEKKTTREIVRVTCIRTGLI